MPGCSISPESDGHPLCHPLLARQSRLGGWGCYKITGIRPKARPVENSRFPGRKPSRVWAPMAAGGSPSRGCSRVGRKQSPEPCEGRGFRSSSVMEGSPGRLLSAWEDWHGGTSRTGQVTASILAFGGAGCRGVGHGQSPPGTGALWKPANSLWAVGDGGVSGLRKTPAVWVFLLKPL